MRVCVALTESKVFFVEVDELGTVEDLKAMVEIESGIQMATQTLVYQGRILLDATSILETGILEGEVLYLQTTTSPLRLEALEILKQSNSQPSYLKFLEQQNPKLAQTVRNGNIDEIEQELNSIVQESQRLKQQKFQQEMELESDPLNPLHQKEIENRIQQKTIDETLKYAEEYTPEVFGRVEMLYIDCKVNGVPIQAFVDSGAQNTIMSQKCAERLGIMRLVDKRFKGMAEGVGNDEIVGRIHAINLEIGGKFFDCCFHILKNAKINMLFGLDMLKRHQCCIDLHKNVLTLDAGNIVMPFIHESLIQKDLKENEEVKMEPEYENKASDKKTGENNPGKTDQIEKKTGENAKANESSLKKQNEPVSQRNPKIESLTRLGFSVAESEQALNLFAGDADKAAAYLFEKNNLFGDF